MEQLFKYFMETIRACVWIQPILQKNHVIQATYIWFKLVTTPQQAHMSPQTFLIKTAFEIKCEINHQAMHTNMGLLPLLESK